MHIYIYLSLSLSIYIYIYIYTCMMCGGLCRHLRTWGLPGRVPRGFVRRLGLCTAVVVFFNGSVAPKRVSENG